MNYSQAEERAADMAFDKAPEAAENLISVCSSRPSVALSSTGKAPGRHAACAGPDTS